MIKYQEGGVVDPTDGMVGETVGTESSLSNWAGDYVTDMLGRGWALADMPYEAYTGPLTAPITSLQDQAFSGIAGLSRKYGLPVYLTRGTWASGRCEGVADVRYFHSGARFDIGEVSVDPIAVPHDAREPCQFVLAARGHRLGILTDLGSVTAAVLDHYQGCDGLLLDIKCEYCTVAADPVCQKTGVMPVSRSGIDGNRPVAKIGCKQCVRPGGQRFRAHID